MKKSIVNVRPAIFLAITLLGAVFVNGQHNFDTTKVIMLVSDTSNKYGLKKQNKTFIFGNQTISSSEYYDWVTDSSQNRFNNGSYWQSGFMVRKFIPAGWGDFDRQIFEHWDFYQYLDILKFPIPKNWIVWQSVSAK
jgi:sulfatase maturation enzyme AslB (radical SAM superfamily)